MLKRAGLDYWDKLDVRTYVNFEDFLAKNPGAKIYMATTKSKQTYTDVELSLIHISQMGRRLMRFIGIWI